MSKQLKVILGVIFVLAVTFILPIWQAQIAQINVRSYGEVPYYTQRDLEIVLGISKNAHILNISNRKWEKYKKSLPFIESLKITKKFPNLLILDIVEKTPLGYIPFNGRYVLVDDQAIVLAESAKPNFDLPVIEGITINNFTIGEKINLYRDDALLTLDFISQTAIAYGLFSDIDSINLVDLENIILKIKKLKVELGNVDNLAKKMNWLSEIYRDYSVGVLDLRNIDSGEAILTIDERIK
ncbi:cell division protein FtsQ/DivIB [Candidatus Epulonipiscium viviparus]|uniref:cell division protein FtsQ/DivIB n=1 Tax=Candidatus Epulonipiscium viviparus TaxID=420336 RepID=UPI00016C01B3|nr:cell division protein FtsQ/DivIB [Candidatus Epulopiscium viviparus]